MRTVVRETSVETIQQADEIEQAGDVRVRLAVVVTEQTFIVTNQAGEDVRSDELIVVRETLRCRNLQCAIVTASGSEATDARGVASQLFCGSRTHAAWVEQEVGCAIVERTIFDDFILGAVDTAEADGQVTHPAGRELKTRSPLVYRLRLKAGIERCCMVAQVAKVTDIDSTGGAIQAADIQIEVVLNLIT